MFCYRFAIGPDFGSGPNFGITGLTGYRESNFEAFSLVPLVVMHL